MSVDEIDTSGYYWTERELHTSTNIDPRAGTAYRIATPAELGMYVHLIYETPITSVAPVQYIEIDPTIPEESIIRITEEMFEKDNLVYNIDKPNMGFYIILRDGTRSWRPTHPHTGQINPLPKKK